MSKSNLSRSRASTQHLRRAAISLVVPSAALLTFWTAGVGARQAKPPISKTPQAKSTANTADVKTSSAKPGTVADPAAKQPQFGNLEFSDYVADQNTNVITAHKFTYTSGDTVITGDNARYDQNRLILDADTNLVMDDPKHHLTGDKSHVERKLNKLTVTNNVVLTLKPDTAASASDPNASVDDAKKQGAVVTCDEIQSFYKRKFNILRGHLVFKQHILRPGKPPLDRTGTAEHAEYDGKKEILVLFPPVHGEDTDDSKFDSDKEKVIISTKAGKETMSGTKGTVVFRVQETDDEGDATSDSAPVPAGGTQTPPPDTKKTEDPKKADDNKTNTGKKDTGKPNPSK